MSILMLILILMFILMLMLPTCGTEHFDFPPVPHDWTIKGLAWYVQPIKGEINRPYIFVLLHNLGNI